VAGDSEKRPYSVIVKPSAERELKKIKNRAVKQRLVAAMLALERNPRPAGSTMLKDAASTAYRIRVGDYRILYTIEDRVLLVTVVTVGHRSEVYR
jgi:mRNA interferase RelE/StbE